MRFWIGLCVIIVTMATVYLLTCNAYGADGVPDTIVIDLLRTSGPAGAAVFILGWTIKHWVSELKKDIGDLRTKLETSTKSHANLKTELVQVRADARDNTRRLETLERKTS